MPSRRKSSTIAAEMAASAIARGGSSVRKAPFSRAIHEGTEAPKNRGFLNMKHTLGKQPRLSAGEAGARNSRSETPGGPVRRRQLRLREMRRQGILLRKAGIQKRRRLIACSAAAVLAVSGLVLLFRTVLKDAPEERRLPPASAERLLPSDAPPAEPSPAASPTEEKKDLRSPEADTPVPSAPPETEEPAPSPLTAREKAYAEAAALLSAGRYGEAVQAFAALGSFRDASSQALKALYLQALCPPTPEP